MTTQEIQRGWLARWYDAGLELPKGLDPTRINEEEKGRILLAVSTVLYAASIPRRLGGDAADGDLSEDKRRCRRVVYALKQAHFGWDRRGIKLPDLTDEIRMAGAHLEWELFGAVHLTEIRARMALVATWAMRNGETAFGKKAITRLDNEHKWVTYALR